MSIKPGEGVYAELGDDGKLKDTIYTKDPTTDKYEFIDTGYVLNQDQKDRVESGQSITPTGTTTRVRRRTPRTPTPVSKPEPVLEVAKKVSVPDEKKVDVTSASSVDDYNISVEAYNKQFTRPDGFKPGEPVYLEIGKDGVKDELLVKGESGKLERSGFEMDSKSFFEEIKEEAKKRDSWMSDSPPSAPPDKNKMFFGKREPGRETISSSGLELYRRDEKPEPKLNLTQRAVFELGKKVEPGRYPADMTRQQFLDQQESRLFGRLYKDGGVVIDYSKSIYDDFAAGRDERVSERINKITYSDVAFQLLGEDKPERLEKLERSWINLSEDFKVGVSKVVSVIGVEVGSSLQDPLRDVAFFGSGRIIGAGVKVIKPVVKPAAISYKSWVASRPVFVRSTLKGTEIGLKTSAVGVIGASVVMDVARADDPTQRAASIVKDAVLFGAGYKAGVKTVKTPSKSFPDDFYPKVNKKTVKTPSKSFPDGYNQISLDFNPKVEMAVKSGKSRMSKASIQRQSRGLPPKGKKIERFVEFRGDQGQIVVPRKGYEAGTSNILKVEKLKPSQQTMSKISTGGLPYQDKGGLRLKRFGITEQARATTQKDTIFRVKPLQRGVKYESSQPYFKQRPQSQASFRPAQFKEVASVQTGSSKSVLLQEQKTKQLLSISFKKLSKAKPTKIYTSREGFGQQFQKKGFNLGKGEAPATTPLQIPSGSQEAQTITQSQGRGKVVDKILERARAKAEARQLELKSKEALVKPRTETPISETKLITPTTKQTTSLDDNRFTNLLSKKKKPSLVVYEETSFRTSLPKQLESSKIIQETSIAPVLSAGLIKQPSLALNQNLDQSNRLKIDQDVITSQASDSLLSPALVLNQAQALESALVQESATQQATTTTNIITPTTTSRSKPSMMQPSPKIIEKPIVTPPTNIPLIKPPLRPTPKPKDPVRPPFSPVIRLPSRSPDVLSPQRFTVKVRRGGVFGVVGVFGSVREAFQRGVDVVGDTAAASFKVKDERGRVLPVSSFSLGARFRPSKSEEGVIVERRRFRISSPGEVREISAKGWMSQRSGGKKSGRGGFNLF